MQPNSKQLIFGEHMSRQQWREEIERIANLDFSDSGTQGAFTRAALVVLLDIRDQLDEIKLALKDRTGA